MKYSTLPKRPSSRKTNKQTNKSSDMHAMKQAKIQNKQNKGKTLENCLRLRRSQHAFFFLRFFLAVHFVFSFQLVLSSYQFFPQYVSSFALFL